MKYNSYPYQLIGCNLYSGSVGFALPIFVPMGADRIRFYMQEPEVYSNIIGEFKPIDLNDASLIRISPLRIAHLGDPLIFCFVNDGGSVAAGTLQELKERFDEYKKSPSRSSDVLLQIAELCGGPLEKKAARANMRSIIRDSSGILAAEAFHDWSVVRVALWEILGQAAVSRDARERIYFGKRSIYARMDGSGHIHIKISGIDPNDYGGLSIDEISKRLRDEIDRTATSKSTPSSSLERPELIRREKAMEYINSRKIYEERIAIILREYIKSDKYAYDALSRGNFYVDNNVRATMIVLLRLDDADPFARVDRLMEKLIYDKVVTDFDLLFYVARELGSYSAIEGTIRRIATRNNIRLGEIDNAIFVSKKYPKKNL